MKMTNSSPEDSKRDEVNEHNRVTVSTRRSRSTTSVELFTVNIYDDRVLEYNLNNHSDDLDRATPPPPFPYSRPCTPISRQVYLPGSVVEDSDDRTNPPPNYVECTFPPPTYDDLYESIEKSRKGIPKKSR